MGLFLSRIALYKMPMAKGVPKMTAAEILALILVAILLIILRIMRNVRTTKMPGSIFKHAQDEMDDYQTPVEDLRNNEKMTIKMDYHKGYDD